MIGWIKINREITNHWIWEDPIKLKWWLDILITVNFEDKKTSIGFKLFECKRGQSLMSLQTWAKRWNVSKTVVNNFFKLLENENMIETVNETVTTRLTVCNYDSYQQTENAKKTQRKRKENATKTQQSTTKEIKEIKEDYKLMFEKFRKLYEGSKRGLNTEFETIKKHKDYKEVIPILEQVIINQIKHRQEKKGNGEFVPPWKNLSTWINQRCWEEEINVSDKPKRKLQPDIVTLIRPDGTTYKKDMSHDKHRY